LNWKEGIKNFVIPLGTEGMIISNLDDSITIEVSSFRGKSVDAIGTGHAFNGGLAIALAR
jgi:sugar/nucleoside kinase (ribokinase family)